MFASSWLSKLFPQQPQAQRAARNGRTAKRRRGPALLIEALENRLAPASSGVLPGIINTVAGGAATAVQLGAPTGVAVDAAGDLFIADLESDVIRKVSPAGVITTVAGNGTFGYSGDGGAATAAQLGQPSGVALDAAGDLFIADQDNCVIRKVSPAGVITTVAGNHTFGYSGDGSTATAAQLNFPSGIAVDAAGDLFIADYGNSVVRKVNPAGVITTVAGNGTFGYSGDGGAATAAQLGSPFGVAVDAAGDLFIADSNSFFREVSPAGVITTVGEPSPIGSLYDAAGVAVDAAGDVFIADQADSVIYELSDGVLTIVAGQPFNGGYSGDGGAATAAQLNYPTGLAVDAAGDLFIADAENNVVREVSPSVVVSPASTTTTLASSSSTAVFGQAVTLTATVVAPAGGTPTGTVTFLLDGSTPLGVGTLNSSGQASISVTTLAVGQHTITAMYSGDANMATSTSTGLTQIVLSAQQELGQIVSQVSGFVTAAMLGSGNGNALIMKLNNAITSLNSGYTTTGVNQMNAFINQASAFLKTGKLDSNDAEALISDIDLAIAAALPSPI